MLKQVQHDKRSNLAFMRGLGGVCEVILSPFPPYCPLMTPAYPPYFESEKKSEKKRDDSECTKEDAS